MLKILGLIVGIYTLISVISGAVNTRGGFKGRRIFRKRDPQYFWIVIMIYASVSVALLSVPSSF